MNRTSVVPLVVALLCVAAIGVSSNTLESSLSTEPDEAIDPDYDALPIGQDDVAQVFEEMGEAVDEGGDSTDEERSEGDPSDEDSGDVDDRDGDPERDDSQAGEADPGDGEGGESLGERIAEGMGTGPDEPSLLDRLLALLVALIRVLLPIVAILAVVVVAIRYRERLLSLLGAGPDEPDEDLVTISGDGELPWPDAEPSNAVDRAWLAMVRRLDPDRPATMTTTECAADAKAAGMDPDAVEAITSAFEQVRYGGAPVTAERERLARQYRRQLEDVSG